MKTYVLAVFCLVTSMVPALAGSFYEKKPGTGPGETKVALTNPPEYGEHPSLVYPLAIRKKDKGIISNGFFLHLGSSFVSKAGFSRAQNLAMYGLEIGNQWYFTDNPDWGIGIKTSWLKVEYGQSGIGNNITAIAASASMFRTGIFGSKAIGDDLAVDVFLDADPIISVGAYEGFGYDNSYMAWGVVFTPGVRLRYKKLAFGAEIATGNISTLATNYDGDESTWEDLYGGRAPFRSSRVYLGFKF